MGAWRFRNVTRSWMPPAKAGISTYYLSANRNKQSLAVDMRKPEGRQLILDLAAQLAAVHRRDVHGGDGLLALPWQLLTSEPVGRG